MSLQHQLLAASYPVLELYNSFSSYTKTSISGRLRVLVYHDIAPEEMERLAAQLRWLSKKWKFIDAHSFELMISGDKPIVGDNLLLTFDDGFSSNRVVAEKILNEMGIRAIFFVVSGFIDISNTDDCHSFIAKGIRADIDFDSMPSHWTNMSWDDLVYLLDSGHTIGAHTATHARLSQVKNDEELYSEIISSADLLEAKLGIIVEHFAFTFGDFTSLSCDAFNVAKQRFKYIYTSLRGNNADCSLAFQVCRDTISPYDNNYLIGAFLAGGADILYKKARDTFIQCV